MQPKYLILLTYLWCSQTLASLPNNSLVYFSDNKSTPSISQQEFEYLIEKFKVAYDEAFYPTYKLPLHVEADWDNPKVNAVMTRTDSNDPKILVYGGLARHPQMDRDTFMYFLCHELGHYFGGAPKKSRGNTNLKSWLSTEGQSDYYASSKCLPKVLGFINSSNKDLSKDQIEVQRQCKDQTCSRILLAGLNAGKIFAQISMAAVMPSLDRADSTIVNSTLESHPSPQCRLDTIRAGANCESARNLEYDDIDESIGYCVRKKAGDVNVDTKVRPLCWYFPK